MATLVFEILCWPSTPNNAIFRLKRLSSTPTTSFATHTACPERLGSRFDNPPLDDEFIHLIGRMGSADPGQGVERANARNDGGIGTPLKAPPKVRYPLPESQHVVDREPSGHRAAV